MSIWKRSVVGAALVLGALCLGAAPSHAEGWHRGGWGRGPRVAVSIGGPYGYAYGPPRAAAWGWRRPYYRPYAYYGGYYPGYYGGYYAAPPPVVYAPQPVVIQSAPVYIEQDATAEASAPSGPSEPAYWYFCASTRQYYPKVSSCREPWVKVLAEDR